MHTWLGRPAFVGRQRELTVLMEHLATAQRGAGGVALVAGEPGIGKTRLLTEFAARAAAEGWTVLSGRAYESEGQPPYLPFVEALRGFARDERTQPLQARLGPGAAQLLLLAPELARLLPEQPADAAPRPDLDRFALFEAVCDLLALIARERTAGLMLVLDDLQWADTPSLQLLQHLAYRLAGAPLVVVAAYRTVSTGASPALTAALAALARAGAASPLMLMPLAIEETATLAAAVSGGVVAAAVAGALQQASDGNPFFVGELVRHLQAEGRDLGDAGVAGGEWPVPELVRQVITARLARLHPETHDLLRLGAVLGDGFSFEVVRLACGLDEDAALEAVEEALAAGLLQAGGEVYHFSHALIRRTLYDALSPPRRGRLHLAAARAIEQVHADRLEPHVAALAAHYLRANAAGTRDTAVAYTIRAGDAAIRVLAFEEAARHWQSALELTGGQEGRETLRARLAREVGRALRAARIEPERTVALFHEAAVLHEAAGQRLEAAEARVDLGQMLVSEPATRDLARAGKELAQAERALRDQPETATHARLYYALAQISHFRMQAPATADAAGQALAIARQHDDEELLAYTAGLHGVALAFRGRVAEALALLDAAWQRAHLHNSLAAARVVLGSSQILDRALEDHADALRWIDREMASGRLRRTPGYRLFWTSMAATNRLELGEVERATAMLDEAGGEDFWIDSYRAEICFRRGQWPEAAARFALVLDLARRLDDQYNLCLFACRAIRAYRTIGDARAERLAREVQTVAAAGGYGVIEAMACIELAHVCAETERVAEARRHVGRGRELLTEDGDWRVLGARLELAGAVVAAAEGEAAAATAGFERALTAVRRYTAPWVEAEMLFEWGRALARAGHGHDARPRFEAARAIYAKHRAGDAWTARVAREQDGPVATHTGEAPVRATSTGAAPRAAFPDGLTAREVEVLRLLARGRSNPEIAEALVLSVHTVTRHANHIFTKIGVSNRVEAATYAQRHGLI